MKFLPRNFSRITVVLALAALPFVPGVAVGGPNPPPGKQAPTNTSPPTVSGSAVEGSTLTADPGTWSGSGIKYSFQWQRCDAFGNGCANVAGATSSGYLLGSADVAKTLQVVVTGSNKNGSSSAVSSATPVVAPAPAPAPASSETPSSTGSPAVSGTPQEGQMLSASSGTWSGSEPMSYKYQWQRCDTSRTSCSSVSGATAQSYSLTSNDVGAEMRVQVTATNTSGSSTAVSDTTDPVTSTLTTPTSSKLTWAPPTLTNPITVKIENSGQVCPSVTSPWQNSNQPWVCYLDPAKDYILKVGHRQEAAGKIGGIVVNGGRNVAIIGGRITIALPTDANLERSGLVFHDQTGTVHVEGVLVDGWPLWCVVLNSARAVFQIQNFRCEGVSMYNENFATAHSDILMTWKSPPLIRIDMFTSDYDGTGLAFYGSRQADGSWTYPGTVILKRTNIRTMSKSPCSNFSKPLSHIYVSSRRQTRIEVDRFFAQTGWGRASITTDCPQPGSFQFTLPNGWATYNGTSDYPKTQKSYGDGLSAGSYFEFTNPSYDNIWGTGGAFARVDYGSPGGGDYVPPGIAGTSYTSPGYSG
jgi:hypothetical protein